jgi:hypothetical protein
LNTQMDLESLRRWLAEESALSSIDIVFFLLAPVTLYLLGQGGAAARDPWSGIVPLLVFSGGLISLPIGVYAKLVDSVKCRILAWTVYILISSWGFVFVCLWYVAFKFLQGFPTETTFSIDAGFNYLMLGTLWSAVGLSSLW